MAILDSLQQAEIVAANSLDKEHVLFEHFIAIAIVLYRYDIQYTTMQFKLCHMDRN